MRWRDFDRLPPLPDAFFDRCRSVHFVGIGGIGMSALALLLKARGHRISGSDACDSPMLDTLRAGQITVAVPHASGDLAASGASAEALIFGSAISADNPEVIAAHAAGIPVWHRAQVLAHLVNRCSASIAVSGTHGKSTTSAMIAHILTECGRNPTALLGAVYPPFGSNVRIGDPDLLVVESDESDGSFTLAHPAIAVVTNVEPERLENYDQSEEQLWSAFQLFVGQARQAAVLDADQVDLYARLSPRALHPVAFGLRHRDGLPEPVCLKVGAPGRHNLSNALAALRAVELIGVDPARAAPTLAGFSGVSRRFEFCGEAAGVVVYDDYGHHPTEVASTLAAASEFLQRPLLVLFQPHRYSRTQQMGASFGPAFAAADRVVITQLYSAFEEPIEGVSGRIVYESVRQAFPEKTVRYAPDLAAARELATALARPGDAIVIMGAGDIGGLPALIVRDLQDKERDVRAA